jgi:hypothetical protein
MRRIETRLLAPSNVSEETDQDNSADTEILAFAEAVRKLQRHHTDPMDDLFDAIHSFGWQPNNRESEDGREGFSFTLMPLSFTGYASSSNNAAPGGFGRTIMITGTGDYEGIALFVQDFIQVLLGDPNQQNVKGQARHLARELLKEEDFFSVEKIRQLRMKSR